MVTASFHTLGRWDPRGTTPLDGPIEICRPIVFGHSRDQVPICVEFSWGGGHKDWIAKGGICRLDPDERSCLRTALHRLRDASGPCNKETVRSTIKALEAVVTHNPRVLDTILEAIEAIAHKAGMTKDEVYACYEDDVCDAWVWRATVTPMVGVGLDRVAPLVFYFMDGGPIDRWFLDLALGVKEAGGKAKHTWEISSRGPIRGLVAR